MSQNYKNTETVVINNSGLPLSPKLEYLEDKCRFVETPDIPRGMARNYGVEHSSGDVIVFTDGDTIICGKNSFNKIARYSEKFSHGYGAQRYWTYPPEMFEENATEYIDAIRKGDNRLLNWGRFIQEEIGTFNPDYIAISAGFDGFNGDSISHLKYTEEGYRELGRLFGQLERKTFAVLEGGYHNRVYECAKNFLDGFNNTG